MTHEISLRKFLKLYTAIPYKFIDEYMDLYDMGTKDIFGIDLELVETFLGISNKKSFYINFRKKYEEYVDYVTEHIGGKKMKDVQTTKYYISLNTFQRVCLSTHSIKGDEVRDYFICLGNFINYYKQHISDMILNNVKSGKYGHVYIMLVNKGKNIFKIGRSDDDDMRKRIYNYSTGKNTHPDLKFIMLVDDPLLVENCSKLFLKEYKYKIGHKELYKVDIDVVRSAMQGCGETNHKIMNIKEKLADYENVDAYIVYDCGKEEKIEIKHTKSKKIKSKSKSKSRSKSKSKSKPKSKKSNKVQKGGCCWKQIYHEFKSQYTKLCAQLSDEMITNQNNNEDMYNNMHKND